MRPALHRRDVVRVAVDILRIAIRVLKRRLHVGAVLVSFQVDGFRVEWVLRTVDPSHELHKAAIEAELLLFLAGNVDADPRPLVEEGVFPNPREEDLGVELGISEDLPVGLEADCGPAARGLPLQSLKALGGHSTLELHVVLSPRPPDSDLQPLREGVYHREAHAVEAPGDLVHLPVELSAGVEGCENDLDTRLTMTRMHVNGNATPIVLHRDDVILRDRDVDVPAEARHGLVDAVVQDFVD